MFNNRYSEPNEQDQPSRNLLKNINIYIENSSLLEDINKLEKPETPLTDESLISLVLKYFYAFVYPDSINQKVSLDEINQLFHKYEHLCIHWNTMKWLMQSVQLPFSLQEDLLDILWWPTKSTEEMSDDDIIEYNAYQLQMLGDVPMTVDIIKDIINQKKISSKTNNKYFWLDLGSGTGILLLAQYLQAKRNGFSQIKNIGIEMSKTVQERANELVQSLEVGEIKKGNTMDRNIYASIITQPINHISNENIVWAWKSMDAEPFFQNLMVMYCLYNQYISKETSFFPNRLEGEYRFGDITPRTADNKNMFLLLKNEEIQNKLDFRAMMNGEDPDLLSLYKYMYPTKIEMSWKMIHIKDTGKELYNLFSRFPRGIGRWWTYNASPDEHMMEKLLWDFFRGLEEML